MVSVLERETMVSGQRKKEEKQKLIGSNETNNGFWIRKKSKEKEENGNKTGE